MSGLLASMVAGGVKNVADTRLKDIEQREEFDMRKALMDADVEKNLRLKELGFQMDQQHATQERERVGGLLQAGRDKLKPQEGEPGGYDPNAPKQYEDMTEQEKLLHDAKTLKDSGDLDGYDKMIARAKNIAPENKGYESVKLDDGSVFSFNKNTGEGKIALEGSGMTDVPKSDLELAWRMADGDPKRAAEILVEQKARVAKAGRAPEKQSDNDQAFADWKKKPENKNKGRDDFERERATWGKDNESESTTEKFDADGELLETSKTTKGKPKPKEASPKKPWERDW